MRFPLPIGPRRSEGRWSANGSALTTNPRRLWPFLTANVILAIPGCRCSSSTWRNELNSINQLGPILLMIFGTIVAASLGRVMIRSR